MVQILTRLLSPLLCLALAIALLWRVSDLSGEQIALLTQLPYVFCTLAALMALFSNHARELGTAIIMLLAYWLIRSHLQASLTTEPAGQIFTLISLCLPLLLALVLILPETGWRHPAGLVAIFSAPVLVLMMWGLFSLSSEWFASQSTALMANGFLDLRVSTLASTLYIASALGCTALLIVRSQNIESSLLGCSLLGFVTFGWFQMTNISAILFTCAGALLVINQVRDFMNLSYQDELTQIANRRALHKAARALRQNYSIAMVDIDHFKKINDTHGHDLGDQVLKVVASKLKQVGAGGRAFRYGGEEFCLLFKGKSAEEIEHELNELRKTIAEYDMVMRDGKNRPKRQNKGIHKRGATRHKSNIRVTVSMGLADSSMADGVFESVMKAADNALYGAKKAGRNRVILA